MNKLIDLSHTIVNGMLTYKGLPAPIICDYITREQSRQYYSAGTEFQIGKIEMVANTGTYIDVPSHRFAHGKDMSEVELRRFTKLDAIVVRADFHHEIG
ncbi:MAG TPA: cyclase family protein [Cyclobacteriaceae bacterium]|nr:cyclase family protein [Cyclobacteriaceae bacterium]HRJ83661.1 cyclase family protein [Cyclobacteriaceae bacterium]